MSNKIFSILLAVLISCTASVSAATIGIQQTSSNELAAKVDKNAKATIVSEGTAENILPDAVQSDETSNGVFSIGLFGKTKVEVGETNPIFVDRWIANDVAKPREVVDRSKCKWSSSDESIARVDAEGNVTGVSEGKATITAICNNFGKEDAAELEITVTPVDQSDDCYGNYLGFDIKQILRVGETIPAKVDDLIVYTGKPETGLFKPTYYPFDASKCKWSSSCESVAKIDENGNITGVSEGTAIITAKYNFSGQEYTDEMMITVLEASRSEDTIIYISDILFDCNKIVGVGKTVPGTVKAVFVTDGINETVGIKPIDSSRCRFISSNEAVAKIDENGNITGVSEGAADITAIYNDSGIDRYGGYSIVVSDLPENEVICFDLVGKGVIDVGEISTMRLEAYKAVERVTGTDQVELVENSQFSWSSSDESVAKVDENGNVTGVSEGTAVITAVNASGQNFANEFLINVMAESHSYNPVNHFEDISFMCREKVGVGRFYPSIIEEEHELAKMHEIEQMGGYKLSFSSSDESVAKVDEKGNITCVSEGKATITAVYNKSGTDHYYGYSIVVFDLPSNDELSDDELSNDELSNDELSNDELSNNEALLNFIGIQLGGENEVEVGKTFAMTAEGMTANETYENENGEIDYLDVAKLEKLDNSKCTWSSSNESVAKIDDNGNVTGVSEGKATITAVYSESGKDYTAELEITVTAAAKSDEPSNDLPTTADLGINLMAATLSDESISFEPTSYKLTATEKPDSSLEKSVNTGSDMTMSNVLAVIAASAAVVITGTKLMKRRITHNKD